MKNIDKKNNNEERNKHTKTKLIICIIIIIIIILLLLTSCTSGFFGKIGSRFNGESDVTITDKPGDREIITNEDLKFKILESTISLDKDVYKISYEKGNLGTTKFSCVTSDANIATCIAKKDYVEIRPKGEGKVVIFVKTDTNGKTYQGTHNLTITESNRRIELARTSATIYLSNGNTINIPYYLKNITVENVKVEVLNKDIAAATATNGVLKVVAKKPGKTNITLSVEYNGHTYKATLKLNVYKDKNNTTTKTTTTKKTTTTTTKINTSETTTTRSTTKTTDTTKKTTSSSTRTTKGTSSSTTDPNKDNVNTLEEIKVVSNNVEFALSPAFEKNKFDYVVKVNYDTSSVNISYRGSSAKETIIPSLDDLSNYSLSPGENIVDIKVTSESGNTNTYTVIIIKPERIIEFDKTSIERNFEDGEFSLSYKVHDGYCDGTSIEINDYNISDINVLVDKAGLTFDKNTKGIIKITPTRDNINENYELTVKYKDISESKIKLKITMNDYYLKVLNTSPYDIEVLNNSSSRDIPIDTNILTDPINKSGNGTSNLTITSAKDAKIVAKTDNNDIKLSYVDGDIRVTVSDTVPEGEYTITLESSILGQNLPITSFKINVIKKYQLIIDPNGGYLDSFDDKSDDGTYKYNYPSGTKIDLSQFKPVKEADGDCMYYKFIGFDTNPQSTTASYLSNQEIELTNNLTLYAIYESTATEDKTVTQEGIMYLSEVDIFKNDEYYKKYNVKNMIYPGVDGNYKITITNSASSDLKLMKINLQEDTICVDGGCINIGYKISYVKPGASNPYIYGNGSNYKILNNDTNIASEIGSMYGNYKKHSIDISGENIVIPKLVSSTGTNNIQEILLSWKWVEIDNALDTKIGDSVNNGKNEYKLSISFEYERNNDHCTTP